MKTFKYTAPEPGSLVKAESVRTFACYINAAICCLLSLPYLALCAGGSKTYFIFNLLSVIWMFTASLALILLQLSLAMRRRNDFARLKHHLISLAMVGAAYMALFSGFNMGCYVSV